MCKRRHLSISSDVGGYCIFQSLVKTPSTRLEHTHTGIDSGIYSEQFHFHKMCKFKGYLERP